MARSLWEAFLSILRRTAGDDGDGEGPSPLDLSVRTAHGGPDGEIDRELAAVEEQADQLAERDRER